MADKKFSQFSVETDLSNFDGLVGFDTLDNYQITKANFYSDLETNLDLDNFTTGELAIAQGGTSSTTAQAAIDTLTNVAGATAGDVLTKSGANAVWQAPAGGTFKWAVNFISNNEFAGTAGTAPTGFPFQGPYNLAANNSSQRIQPCFIPFDCTLTAMYWKYNGDADVTANAAGDISDLFIYTYTGGDSFPELSGGWDTTGDNAAAIYSELVEQADDGTWPQKSATGLSRTFTAGQLIMPFNICLLYTSPSPRDGLLSRMPSSA